jgi:hypothetical protein
LPKYKVTYTSPVSVRPGFLRIDLGKQETKSQIIEALNLEMAEQMAGEERMRYPIDLTVSVEEIAA